MTVIGPPPLSMAPPLELLGVAEVPRTWLFVKVQPLTIRGAPPNLMIAPPLPLPEGTRLPGNNELEMRKLLFVARVIKTAPPPLEGSADKLLVKVLFTIEQVPVLGLCES